MFWAQGLVNAVLVYMDFKFPSTRHYWPIMMPAQA